MLCGVVAVGKNREGWEKDYWGMYNERLFLGATMGNMEGWLGVRSLRTLELRVMRQSRSTTELVTWLHELLESKQDSTNEEADVVKRSVTRVQHASLQKEDMGWLKEQMPNGYGPVFAIWMKNRDFAKRLPSTLNLFHHATSLGGVESLIEWRRMSDDMVDDRVLRVSIGIEDCADLKQDMLDGFRALLGSI